LLSTFRVELQVLTVQTSEAAITSKQFGTVLAHLMVC